MFTSAFFFFCFDLRSTLNVENPRHDVRFNELIRVEHRQEQPAVEWIQDVLQMVRNVME